MSCKIPNNFIFTQMGMYIESDQGSLNIYKRNLLHCDEYLKRLVYALLIALTIDKLVLAAIMVCYFTPNPCFSFLNCRVMIAFL